MFFIEVSERGILKAFHFKVRQKLELLCVQHLKGRTIQNWENLQAQYQRLRNTLWFFQKNETICMQNWKF